MRNALERFPEELHLPLVILSTATPPGSASSLSGRYQGEANVWHATAPKAFGLRRDYGKKGSIVNGLTDWAGWPAKLAAHKQFLSWGLHLKENPIKVENMVPTTG